MVKSIVKKFEMAKQKSKKGFSLVELLIVIVIIGILAVVSFVAIQRARSKAMNEKMLDDLIAIANALEDYKRDHDGKYPLPEPDTDNPINQNVLCYYEDATYAHDCDDAAFRQGMIDNALLSQRYLREVPADPRTGSRYVYGATNDQRFYQVAGVYEGADGIFEARTAENLVKGFEYPSVIRAYDSANFVVDKGPYLPYSPDYLTLTATLDNIKGTVTVKSVTGSETSASNGLTVKETDTIKTGSDGKAEIYFSDGSVAQIDVNSELELKDLRVDKNDADGTSTIVILKLNLGKIWSKVVRLAEKSDYRVETVNAIAGVRGTEYGVEALTGGILKEVTVLAGDVEVRNPKTGAVTVDFSKVKPSQPEKAAFAPDGGSAGADLADASDISAMVGYYKDIPLNTGMRPYILSAKGEAGGGAMTVRDIDFYVKQVDESLGRKGTDLRHILADRLAVYNVDATGKEIFISAYDISGSAPYTLSNLPLDKFLFLRFEYCPSFYDLAKECGAYLKRKSAFASPPISLSADTDLTDEDIYPNLFREEKPELSITAPEAVSIKTGAAAAAVDFDLEAVISNYTIKDKLNYTVTPGDSTVCKETSGSTTTAEFTVPVSALVEGTCGLTMKVTLENGSVLAEEISVQIVPEGEKVVLLSPEEGDSLPKAGQAITFKWAAPNAPTGASYDISIADPKNGAVTGASTVTYYPATGGYTLQAGSYSWKVSMKEAGAVTYTTSPSAFTVTEAPMVEFKVSNKTTNTTILPHGTKQYSMSIDDKTQPVELYVEAATPPTGFKNEWSLSNFYEPKDTPTGNSFTAKIDASKLAQNASMYSSITLTVRDTNSGNVADTITKGITVSTLPLLTYVTFSGAAPTSPLSPNQTWSIPDLTATPSAASPVSPSQCASLTSTIANTISNGIYTAPAGSPLTSDTITCGITSGTKINNHIAAGNLIATITITLTGSGPVCGSNGHEAGEACDDMNAAANDGCTNCSVDAGYTCTDDATLPPKSVCTLSAPTCGNGVIDTGLGEVCDGTLLGGQTCELQGFKFGGTLNCATDCKSFVTSSCKTLANICPAAPAGSYDTSGATPACWILGASGANCDTACGVVNSEMKCDTGLTWNDNTTCDICKILMPSATSCGDTTINTGPYTFSVFCKYRKSSVTQSCTASTASLSRICKCQ